MTDTAVGEDEDDGSVEAGVGLLVLVLRAVLVAEPRGKEALAAQQRAMPQSASGPASPGSVTVTSAYVRAPVPPTRIAAAYFTVYNTTAADDRLQNVVTGAGASAVLHTIVNGRMSAAANGAVIAAHGRLTLATGQGHVMIEHLFGTLKAGQDVDIQLTFRTAGTVDVVAPVIAVGAPPPTQAGPAQSSPSPSGAHS